MSKRILAIFNVCTLLFLTILLIGCDMAFQEVHLTEIPVNVSQPASQDVDIDAVIENVTPRVRDILPNAQLGGIVYSGSCENLLQLRGKIVLHFVETRFSIPKERVISAIASINTIQQTMDFHVRDETNFYLSTETLEIEEDNLGLAEIAAKAAEQIKASGLSDCDVTITRLEDSWDVRCGPLENFIQECHFEVHSTTGEVILLEN